MKKKKFNKDNFYAEIWPLPPVFLDPFDSDNVLPKMLQSPGLNK